MTLRDFERVSNECIRLKEENQELKNKFNEAIHKATESESEVYELKKQLEEYKNSQSCSFVNICKNVKIANYNQQKEFIKFLEDNWEQTQDIWYIKILQKYKEIIEKGDVR